MKKNTVERQKETRGKAFTHIVELFESPLSVVCLEIFFFGEAKSCNAANACSREEKGDETTARSLSRILALS
jgi:hypothetical protein